RCSRRAKGYAGHADFTQSGELAKPRAFRAFRRATSRHIFGDCWCLGDHAGRTAAKKWVESDRSSPARRLARKIEKISHPLCIAEDAMSLWTGKHFING